MVFEYLQLTGVAGGMTPFDFALRVGFLALAGVLMALAGFKIKGAWGAAAALVLGGLLFLWNEGVVDFGRVLSFLR
jgi:hypothetical protein